MNQQLPSSTFRPVGTDPRSVYIHIPFCRHRCGYCNFTLVAGRDYLVDRFLSAIAKEIEWLEQEYEIDTLFLGGGTPSHLNSQQLAALFEILGRRFRFVPDAEITAECNPSDLDQGCADALANCGVNRVSLGVQSLNLQKLKRLERDHDETIIRRAVENARGFVKSLSVDLIFAAPEETLEEWKVDVATALELKPNHVSTYELTYEKGTTFWNRKSKGKLESAGEELRCQMYEYVIDEFARNGLGHYEVSSFSQPGHRCRHNLIYWTGRSFFAFGPGAARFINGFRETNHRSTTQYIQLLEQGKSPIVDVEQVEGKDAALEQIFLGLRLRDGIELAEFQSRTGFDCQELIGLRRWNEFLKQGLWELKHGSLTLTRRGLVISDWIAGEVLGGPDL